MQIYVRHLRLRSGDSVFIFLRRLAMAHTPQDNTYELDIMNTFWSDQYHDKLLSKIINRFPETG